MTGKVGYPGYLLHDESYAHVFQSLTLLDASQARGQITSSALQRFTYGTLQITSMGNRVSLER